MSNLGAGASPLRSPQPDVGLDKEALKRAFLDNLFYMQGKFPALATKRDYYLALAYMVRDRLLQRWVSTAAAYTEQRSRTVAYLSAEFLIGPHLGNNLINLGIYEQVAAGDRASWASTSTNCCSRRRSPAWATAVLGGWPRASSIRWRRCEIPTLGYGIRYEFGIFEQEIVDGWQVERTDKWLRFGNPWDIARPGVGRRGEARRPHRALHRRARALRACAGCPSAS